MSRTTIALLACLVLFGLIASLSRPPSCGWLCTQPNGFFLLPVTTPYPECNNRYFPWCFSFLRKICAKIQFYSDICKFYGGNRIWECNFCPFWDEKSSEGTVTYRMRTRCVPNEKEKISKRYRENIERRRIVCKISHSVY